jgi:hypothetical protein
MGLPQPPAVPLAQTPTPRTSDPDVALVKSAIDNLRSGGADKATGVQAGATLTFQKIAFVLVPDTWVINIAVKRPKVRSRRSCQRKSYKMESYSRVMT